MTKDQALALALDWAEGRRSWTNQIVGLGPDRATELVRVAQAAAAEVAKWTALYAVLPDAPGGAAPQPPERA